MEAVARRALAPGFDGDAESVDRRLVEAVAHGRGERSSVQEVTRRAFGDDAPLELVIFDTDRIGGWVYESSRPPVIAGASKILERLNHRIARELYPEAIVFSGGGDGLLLVPRGEGKGVEQGIAALYAKETDGALTVTTSRLEVTPEELVATPLPEEAPAELLTGTPAVLTRLGDCARRNKEGTLPPAAPVPGHQKRCASCRDRAGVEGIDRFRYEARGLLCPPCVTRWEVGKELIAGISFDEVIKTFQGQLRSPGARDRYLGFLYADGDAMGLLFRRVRSLAEFRFLSQAVAGVFERVRGRALEHTRELVDVDREDKLPFLSLLGGGDEVILLLPAALAVDVATRIPGWIDAATAAVEGLTGFLQRADRPSLTVGMGLVVADLHYPVRYQFELAKELQSNAKRRFYGTDTTDTGEAGSTIDFTVLTDASPSAEDLEAARTVTYGTADPGFVKTCRPYRVERLRQVLDAIRAARRHGVATTQLYQLRDGAEAGEAVFANLLRYQIGRDTPGKILRAWLQELGVDPTDREALTAFFVEPRDGGARRGLWLPDALELTPFLELLEQLGREGDDAAA